MFYSIIAIDYSATIFIHKVYLIDGNMSVKMVTYTFLNKKADLTTVCLSSILKM